MTAPDADVLLTATALRRNHWLNHLRRHAHERPDAVALRFAGASTTWAGLAATVGELAAGLAARGVGSGDRVGIMMTNRPEFLHALLAANSLGAIAVPVNFRLTADEVGYLLAHSGARLVLADPVGAPVAAAAAGPDVRLIVTDDVTAEAAPGAERLAAVPVADAGLPVVDVPEDGPAVIMYTSGTTGRPKGAVLSHQNLQGQAFTLIRTWRLFDDTEITLCASPLFHIASIGGIAPMLLVGGTTVLLPSGNFSAADTLALLERERVTSVFLVPAQWQALCAEPTLAERDLSALRTTSWGAAPATTTLLERMAQAFPHVVNVAVFGQTEMSPVTCALDGADALRKLGSVGRPVSTVAIRVVDELMADVPRGEVGEIVYRGPTTMLGYWQDDAATAEAFRGGWFHSGDLVRQDDEGFVYVVDRVKDMIITGGENVYCAEVENVLAGHPDVVEVTVIGAPSATWGETPAAVVVPAPGRELTLEQLREFGGRRLARYKLPTVLHVVDALPRNASGKVTKGELRRRFRGA